MFFSTKDLRPPEKEGCYEENAKNKKTIVETVEKSDETM